MQQFAIKARKYMSKNHHFSHVMMLHFYFWTFSKLVCCYVLVIVNVHMSLVIYLLRNNVWTKNNKDMA